MLRLRWLALTTLFGCHRAVEPTPTVLRGDAEAGYGIAIAWHDGDLWVGAPLRPEGGRLYRGEQLVLTGDGRDLLGNSVASGPRLAVGAPRAADGRGQVVDAAGAALATGEPGQGLGARVAWRDTQLVATDRGGVWLGDRAWSLPERGQSLLSAAIDGAPVVLATSLDGSVWQDGERLLPADADEAAALAVCDDRLYVAAPGAREVRVYAIAPFVATPLAVVRGPARSVACAGGALWSGGGGEVWRWEDPLRDARGRRLGQGAEGSDLGASLAVDRDRGALAAGAPGEGAVWLFDVSASLR